MDDSSKMFVETLRNKLADHTGELATDTSGIHVQEHDFEELDERTQANVEKLFETMRLRKEQLADAEDAVALDRTVRTKALAS